MKQRPIPEYAKKMMEKDKLKKKEKQKKLYSDRWDTIRRQVYMRDGYRCVMCGKKGRLAAHHIVPLRVSHNNSLSNLVSVCAHCHKKLESVGFSILEAGGHKEDVYRTEFKMIAEAQRKRKERYEAKLLEEASKPTEEPIEEELCCDEDSTI